MTVKKKIKNIIMKYLSDPMGEQVAEMHHIQRQLQKAGIPLKVVSKMSLMTGYQGYGYDVLFFDWGGAMMGNSIMESYCRYIIENAENNPSRIFVMTSSFTRQAMEDAMHEINPKPPNIFLGVDSCTDAIKDLINE